MVTLERVNEIKSMLYGLTNKVDWGVKVSTDGNLVVELEISIHVYDSYDAGGVGYSSSFVVPQYVAEMRDLDEIENVLQPVVEDAITKLAKYVFLKKAGSDES